MLVIKRVYAVTRRPIAIEVPVIDDRPLGLSDDCFRVHLGDGPCAPRVCTRVCGSTLHRGGALHDAPTSGRLHQPLQNAQGVRKHGSARSAWPNHDTPPGLRAGTSQVRRAKVDRQ